MRWKCRMYLAVQNVNRKKAGRTKEIRILRPRYKKENAAMAAE